MLSAAYGSSKNATKEKTQYSRPRESAVARTVVQSNMSIS